MAANPLDCIVVGFNNIDFGRFAESQKTLGVSSGAYRQIQANSVFLDGRRVSTIDLLNQTLSAARGVPVELSPFEAPNLAVCYLASYLRRRGLAAGIVNYFNKEREAFREALEKGPRAVAITTTYYVEPTPIREIVDFIRTVNPDVPIVVGGPHVLTVASDHELETQDYLFDAMGADVYITDSQGEGTLAEFVKSLRAGLGPASVANLIYRDADGFRRTPRRKEENDLDENLVDWTTFSPEFVRPLVYMRTARSCPFSCAFCNFPVLAGEHGLASIDAIEREMKTLRAAGVEYINFIDDTFNVPLPRFKKLLRMMIANRFEFRWVSFFRCSNADDETFQLMRESGCIGVFLGIEAGDQRVLNNMNKFADLDRYRYGIEKLTGQGIVSHGSFIVGFPGETEQSVRNTLAFLEGSPTTFFSAQLCFLDPQSPIYRRAAQFGIEGAGYSWRHNSMNWKEAADWTRFLISSVKQSTALTLYGDVWSIPYLISKGISVDTFARFSRVARDMIVAGFDDAPGDFTAQHDALRAIFA